MPKIYDYLDYQAFLKDCYAAQKAQNRNFSYRYMGQKVGLDHSVVVKVLQGQRHLSREQVLPFAKLFKLDRTASKYLLALVDYNRATTPVKIQHSFEKLLSLKPADQDSVMAEHYQYFQKWHHVVLRSLLDYYPFYGADFADLGCQLQPQISAAEAEASVQLLLDLGMVKIDEQGRYVPTASHLSTGERWLAPAIQKFQHDTILLSAQALQKVAREWRDISTLTLSLDSSDLEAIRQVLTECRQKIVGIVDRMPPEKTDAVYQLNMQFVPLTEVPHKRK